jgi:hypothetical protein
MEVVTAVGRLWHANEPTTALRLVLMLQTIFLTGFAAASGGSTLTVLGKIAYAAATLTTTFIPRHLTFAVTLTDAATGNSAGRAR